MRFDEIQSYRRAIARTPALKPLAARLNALESLQDAVAFCKDRTGSNSGQWHAAAVELDADVRAAFAAQGVTP